MQQFPDFALFPVLQSYPEGRQRGVPGAHCSLGTADHQGNLGQVSPFPSQFGQLSGDPPKKRQFAGFLSDNFLFLLIRFKEQGNLLLNYKISLSLSHSAAASLLKLMRHY